MVPSMVYFMYLNVCCMYPYVAMSFTTIHIIIVWYSNI